MNFTADNVFVKQYFAFASNIFTLKSNMNQYLKFSSFIFWYVHPYMEYSVGKCVGLLNQYFDSISIFF